VESRTQYWEWTFSGESPNHRYLVPAVVKALRQLPAGRILDIGCGNGALTGKIAAAGFDVTGIDFTSSGIDRARQSFPTITFLDHDINEPLPEALLGQFDVVLSAEVIEHLFLPRSLFTRAREALGVDGHMVVSTPYHGYVKNLVMAASGKFDHHWQVGSDFGHIKFFSERTLEAMARECGFEPIARDRGGRIRPLAATMVMTAKLLPQVASGTATA
jgi:2-polyprenyl-3-methyl-5-hydroxy-6-metoxy-1,4-benzoquinol methylase